jgi:hypothetical protein
MSSGNSLQRDYWEDLEQVNLNLVISEASQKFEQRLVRQLPSESDDTLRTEAIRQFDELLDDVQAYRHTVVSNPEENSSWRNRTRDSYREETIKRELNPWFISTIKQLINAWDLANGRLAIAKTQERFSFMKQRWDKEYY